VLAWSLGLARASACELLAGFAAGGFTPAEALDGQVLAAFRSMYATGAPGQNQKAHQTA